MSSKPFETPLLAYGLNHGVELHHGRHGDWLLISRPLTAIRCHSSLRPVLESLARGGLQPLSRLYPLCPNLTENGLIKFLDTLVRKGVLQVAGSAALRFPPLVSVIIPVRNRPRLLASCLDSLGRLNYPVDRLEVIVVDDGSTDGLTPGAASRFPVRLLRLDHPHGASRARNLGVNKARGEILAFVDSDCQVHPFWLRELLPAFQDSKVAAVGGLVHGAGQQSPLERYEQVRSSLFLGRHWRRSSGQDPFFYLPSCNLLIRRHDFARAGGFRAGLQVGEDVDLCWRLVDQGALLEYRPQGTVFHEHRTTLAGFAGRRFQYGTSEPLLQRIHPGRRKSFTWPAAQGWQQRRALMDQGVTISKARIFTSMVRSWLAFAVHLVTFVSRYWLIWALPLFYFWPGAAFFVVGAHLLSSFFEYRALNPRLGWPLFFLLFTVEQCAYQAGVWWGCIRKRTLAPLNPRLGLGDH